MSQTKKSKTEILEALRSILREALRLHGEGGLYPKLARLEGRADGYMKALLDLGIVTEHELLALVTEERRLRGGPATRAVSEEDASPPTGSIAAA